MLKNNHPISFSFCAFNDYNSRIIKVFLFFFSLCLELAINALFFNDDTMHKIYEDKGKYDFIYQIPQILYSTLISGFINSFIRNFALTQDLIVELKQRKINFSKLVRKLKINFILFFVLAFMFLMLILYYISCFCVVYENTQFHLFKDTLLSIMSSFIMPIGLCLFPGIFRIPSLRGNQPTRKYLFKFSMLFVSLFC